MLAVRQTEEFRIWFEKLKDRQAVKKIAQRIVRIQSGLMGDVKYFSRIGEIRIQHGPGYRIYFVKRGETIIILLCGGDKSSQKKDIEKAKQMAKEVSI